MISFDEAGERVNKRLERMGAEPYSVVTMPEKVGLLCVGTDVRAPELIRYIKQVVAELDAALEAIAEGVDLPPAAVLQGLLMQVLWVGFEHGAVLMDSDRPTMQEFRAAVEAALRRGAEPPWELRCVLHDILTPINAARRAADLPELPDELLGEAP